MTKASWHTYALTYIRVPQILGMYSPKHIYKRKRLYSGFSNVEVVDSGADLNAYAKVENQSGCCSPMTETLAPESSVSATSSRALPVAAASCCSPDAASGDLHEVLADLLGRYNVNDYAASVKVYAVK